MTYHCVYFIYKPVVVICCLFCCKIMSYSIQKGI